MSYAGNLDTAQIYIKAGLKDRAYEYLRSILSSIPQDEQKANNISFMRSLVLMAKLSLERNDRQECVRCIERGLAERRDHADLLFLKALMYWDVGNFDDMFLTLVSYLAALTDIVDHSDQYEYTSEKTVAEVLHHLVPEAYGKSANKIAFMQSIQTMAGRGTHPLIAKLAAILGKVNTQGIQTEAGQNGATNSEN